MFREPSTIRHRSGFTLIELLVVVAIIAVLAAMLLPVLGRAKEQARTAVCANNLRQHHAAFMAYTDDFGDFLVPYIAAVAGSPSEIVWQTLLIRLKYLPREKSYYDWWLRNDMECPSNLNGYYATTEGHPGDLWYDGTINYLYNYTAGHNASSPPAYPIKKLAAITRPASKAMLLEAGYLAQWGTPHRCAYHTGPLDIYFTPGNVSYSIGDVHNNRSNVLFFDGHVESFARGTIDYRITDLDTP